MLYKVLFKELETLSIAWVYPVIWHRGWMDMIRGRELAEIFRLPGAHIKLRVAIGSLTQVEGSRALKRVVSPRLVTEQGKDLCLKQ